MNRPSATFTDLLAGKSPEAMYDELHARRYLSEDALQSPAKVVDLIKLVLRSHWQRPFTPATKLERVAQALAAPDCLNDHGMRIYKGSEY